MFKMNFLKMRTRSALRKNLSMRASIPYKQTKSVGIVFSVDDKQTRQDVKEFIRILELDGKQVKVLEFLPNKKENYDVLFDFFSIDDLSFWGKINSETADNFSKTGFYFEMMIKQEGTPKGLMETMYKYAKQLR